MTSTPVHCSSCSLNDLCLPVGLTQAELKKLDGLVSTRRKVPQGSALYRSGDPFSALYAIRTGFFKTEINTADGRGHVTGFQMMGEIMGLDGITQDHHACDAIALEDAEVCVMDFDRIESLSRELDSLQRHLHKVMSREIVRDQGAMMLLSIMNAEERVASFLANLVDRLKARGFSSSELILRMARKDIGSHLGMTIETVSRVLSRMVQDGMITVNQRHIVIANPQRLLEKASLSRPG